LQHSSDRSYLFVVADGMGGRAGGEKASAFAIESVESFVLESLKWFAECKGEEHDAVLNDFQSALLEASSRIRAEAAESPNLQGMGTTLTLAYRLNSMLFIAHAGDSRCYLFRHSTLHRLTRDHSLVEDWVRQGVLSAQEATRHPLRHVITNALGGADRQVHVEVHKIHLEADDTVLLCSDGLTKMLSDENIAQVLQTETDPERACRELVAHANEEGGTDNITVVVAHFDDANEPARGAGAP
jgi:protein phosphatase